MSNRYAALVESKARQYGIDPFVFKRMVGAESDYDQGAVSHKGAIGLGQLMPETARELGVNPNDPVQNVDGSARYLRQQLDRFGSYPLALAAYNAGPEAVAKYKGIPPYKETRSYVMKILENRQDATRAQEVPSMSSRIIKNLDSLFGPSVSEAAEIPKSKINPDSLFGEKTAAREGDDEQSSGFDWGNVGTKAPGSVAETKTEPQTEMTVSGNMVKKPIPKDGGFDWGTVGSTPNKGQDIEQDPNNPQWTKDYPRVYNATKGAWELVEPTVDALAATGGAAIGTVAGMPAGPVAAGLGGVLGAGMGYSSAQHMKDIGAEALGFTPVKDVPERIAQSASDVASGAAMEMGGQIAGKVIGSTAGFLRKHYPFGKEAVKNRAGEILQENASPTSIISGGDGKLPQDSYYARNLAKADKVEREIPGLTLSVGAKTDDPGLIKLQRGLEVRGGDAAYLMKEAQAKNHQAVKEYLNKYFPEAENLDEVTDALVNIKSNIASKSKAASDAVTRRVMQLNPMDEQRTGQAVVDQIQATRTPLKAEERRLWSEVPNYPIPTTNTSKAFSEAITKPSTSIDKVKSLKSVYDATPKTSEGLHVIEQEVNSAMYSSSATDTDRKILGAIKQAIKEDFEVMGKAADSGDVALANGSVVYPSQLKSELDTVNQRIGQETSKLQVAPDKDAIIAALREKKIPSMRQVQEEEGSFLDRISTAFKRAYPDRELPTIGTGSGQSPELEALLKRKTNLENVLGSMEPAENVARAYSAAKNYTKDVIVPKFKTGATKEVLRRGDEISGLKMPHENVPRQFWTPTGADDLIRSIGKDEATALMDTYAANEILKGSGGGELSAKKLQSWVLKHKPVLDKYGLTEKYASLAKAQSAVDDLKVQQADFEKSVFAKMIDADPREAIKVAFGGTKNTAKVAMDIMNRIKDNPKAVTGFQNAFKDFMYSQAETTAETLGRDSVLSPASLIKQLKRYDPAMKVIYKNAPEKMKAIQTVRDSFEIASRSGRPVGSGSDTAEKLSVQGSILNEVFSHLPGAGMVVKLWNLGKAAQRKVTQNDVQNLVARALYDPDLAMDLIKISKGKFSKSYSASRLAYYLTIYGAVRELDD